MAALGPFARPPRLAVACSGGADSMALSLLAGAWARRRGGSVTALTVDHGLRRESAREARRVGAWLAARGIAHQVLRWRGAKPAANVAAAARAARYGLLLDWCRRRQVGDLLVAHHQEDQAETFLLRLARGSGVDGLAAMAPVVAAAAGVRLLRPLLGVPRARLRATLARRHQAWIEDPSNDDPAYARNRMRKLLPLFAAEGLGVPRLAATAARMAAARTALEVATAGLLRASAVLHPAGFALLDVAVLEPVPAELQLRSLSRLLMLLGGLGLPPRLERLERLRAMILAGGLGGGRTLAGCRLLPYRGRLLVCREPAAVAGPLPLRNGGAVHWDGRFAVSLHGAGRARGFRVAALGAAGWRALAAAGVDRRDDAVPSAVRPTLPALWHLDAVLAVPHLHFRRDGTGPSLTAEFRPLRPLAFPDLLLPTV